MDALERGLQTLEPATDLDILPIQVRAARARNGRLTVVKLSGEGAVAGSHRLRFFWSVDIDRGTFSAVQLFGDASDLDRLMEFRRRIGKEVSSQIRRRFAEKLARWERDLVLAKATHAPGHRSTAIALTEDLGAASLEAETTAESCDGEATTMHGVEDPVGIDVTQTTQSSSWYRDAESTSHSGWYSCWGKPGTGWLWPLDTTWNVDSCDGDNEGYNPGFANWVTGNYINWDFWWNSFATGSSSYVEHSLFLPGQFNWYASSYVWGEASFLLSGGYDDHAFVESCTSY